MVFCDNIKTKIKIMRMKKLNLCITFFVAVMAFSACKNAPESDEAVTSDPKKIEEAGSATTLIVDASASKVEWVGTKVSGHHHGTIDIKSGDINIKDGNITGGKIIMDMSTITVLEMDEASTKKLTGHLKSPDFFDVSNHSEALFELTGSRPYAGASNNDDGNFEEINEYKVPDPTHIIMGNLTIRGITKGIEFPAKVTINGDEVMAISKFNIDRTQWDVKYTGMQDDLISNSMFFGISLKAHK